MEKALPIGSRTHLKPIFRKASTRGKVIRSGNHKVLIAHQKAWAAASSVAAAHVEG